MESITHYTSKPHGGKFKLLLFVTNYELCIQVCISLIYDDYLDIIIITLVKEGQHYMLPPCVYCLTRPSRSRSPSLSQQAASYT